MFSVEPTGFGTRDKELAAVGVGAGISHRENARLGMSQLEVFIFKPGPINRFATGAVVISKITTLAHEIRNHPMEAATLVTETLFSGAQGTKVLCCLRNDIFPQLKTRINNSINTSYLFVHVNTNYLFK